ncbi:MAG TPA: NAD(P)-dependent oxidoreductase [Planctomycetota bacterium]|nr:NAD(P)-dependent oxidoreductase [Planctomycetota bacterium]
MRELPACDFLLTGATGFLGGAVLQRLLLRGLRATAIRCLVRDRGRALAQGIPADSVFCADLANPADSRALAAAVEGAGVVLHLAGAVKAWNRSGFEGPNVDGTRRLLAAVENSAPSAHFLLVSSLAAAGPSTDGASSTAMPDRCCPVSAYGDSKRRAELAVVQGRLPWTIVRPPIVYGPADAATRLLFKQACAPVTAVLSRPRPLSVIHRDDVVEALLHVLSARPSGAVLALDGPERTDTHSLLRAMATACGRTARLVPVPMPFVGAAALISDLFAALRHRAAFFNRDKMREIRAAGWVADGSVAKGLLGYEPAVSLSAGLLATARAEGFVRSSATPTSTTA